MPRTGRVQIPRLAALARDDGVARSSLGMTADVIPSAARSAESRDLYTVQLTRSTDQRAPDPTHQLTESPGWIHQNDYGAGSSPTP